MGELRGDCAPPIQTPMEFSFGKLAGPCQRVLKNAFETPSWLIIHLLLASALMFLLAVRSKAELQSEFLRTHIFPFAWLSNCQYLFARFVGNS